MKKTYITPAIEVVEVEVEGIIAASMDLNNETVNTQMKGTRRNSDWDAFED